MRPSIVLALLALASGVAPAQTPANRAAPRTAASTQPGADVLGEFAARLSKYSTLRTELEKGLPPLTGSDEPARVREVETALAARVRDARAGAKQGDVFTPDVTAAFRKILRRLDPGTWNAIMDENPGPFPSRVNDSYPKTKPLSSVPPDLLARLPALPEGLQYRFVGGDLILHDTRANLIVDRIPEAIPLGRAPRVQRPRVI
jgi:hypothetical protein